MTLKLVKVHGHGKQAEEYVELAAVEDCNLTKYLLMDTTYHAAGNNTVLVSNKLRHVHWFVSQDVKKGDLVYLRTGKGTASKKEQPNGSTVHTIFWGLKEPVWNDDGDGALLFEVGKVQTKKVVE